MVKAYELRLQKKDELNKTLEELKNELATLRVQKVAGNQKVNKIHYVRKSIARTLTIISHKSRDALKEFYKGKKHSPLDLRVKKTRAIRRRLTKFETSRKTVRQMKHEQHFSPRKFAVKA